MIKPGASVNTMVVHIYDDASNKMVAQGTHIKVSAGDAWVSCDGVEGLHALLFSSHLPRFHFMPHVSFLSR